LICTDFIRVVAVFVCFLTGFTAAPVAAYASPQMVGRGGQAILSEAVVREGPTSDPNQRGQIYRVAAPILMIPYIEDLLEMDFRRLLAWIGGLTIGNVIMSGFNIPYVGLIAGALIGEYWYKNKIFPFDGTF